MILKLDNLANLQPFKRRKDIAGCDIHSLAAFALPLVKGFVGVRRRDAVGVYRGLVFFRSGLGELREREGYLLCRVSYCHVHFPRTQRKRIFDLLVTVNADNDTGDVPLLLIAIDHHRRADVEVTHNTVERRERSFHPLLV